MTSIDPRQRLSALVRGEISAFRERAGAPDVRKTRNNEGAQGSGAPAAAVLLAQRVGAISPNDPERRHKAFRVFLESTLLHQLGADLVQDPQFPQMVDAVQARLNEDAQLAGAAEAVAVYLLGESGSGAVPRK